MKKIISLINPSLGTITTNVSQKKKATRNVVDPRFLLLFAHKYSDGLGKISKDVIQYMSKFLEPLLIEQFTKSDLSSKWDIDVTNGAIQCSVNTQEGFFNRSALPLTIRNSWNLMKLKKKYKPPFRIDFNLRISESIGTETKFTVTRKLILRRHFHPPFSWNTWNGSHGFTKRGDSTVGADGSWIHITQNVFKDYVEIYENGELMVHHTTDQVLEDEIIFHVQHLDANTRISLDISCIEINPI